MKRRLFLFAAPAIVAAPSLMRVSALVRKETIWELMDRRIKAAEVATRADLERVMSELWENGTSDSRFGLASLLTADVPTVGIDRTSFQWWDASSSVTYYGGAQKA
jgi:hypothetical protein